MSRAKKTFVGEVVKSLSFDGAKFRVEFESGRILQFRPTREDRLGDPAVAAEEVFREAKQITQWLEHTITVIV